MAQPVTASEQDRYVRVEVYLASISTEPIIVHYATEPVVAIEKFLVHAPFAQAGVDFVATQGFLTIPPGETQASIDVPLIDNAVVDGPREFGLRLDAADSNGGVLLHEARWIRIEDNELGSASDPLFLPPIQADPTRRLDLVALPDGRWLAEEGGNPSVSGPPRLRVFEADGSEVIGFALNVLRSQRLHGLGSLRFVAPTKDGSLVATGFPEDPNDRVLRVLRLNPDGSIRIASRIPVPSSPSSGYYQWIPGAQSDGKVLVVVGIDEKPAGPFQLFRLFRVQEDGSRDLTFHEFLLAGSPSGIVIDSEDRILLDTWDPTLSARFKRLRPDGSVDPAFSLTSTGTAIESVMELRDRSLLLLREDFSRLYLSPAGEVLPAAGSIGPAFDGFPFWPLTQAPDGSLWGSKGLPFDAGIVAGSPLASEGSSHLIRVSMPLKRLGCGLYVSPDTPGLLWSGSGLLVSRVSEVEGVPCRGVARLRANPPEQEFRVVTSIESSRAGGVATVKVVRTGPTTKPASISFVTVDGTARSGTDFVPMSGRLEFAPLEVGKEVSIRLLPATGTGSDTSERRTLSIALSEGTEGYSVVPATPVEIAPELRLAMKPHGSGDAAGELRAVIHGTQPGDEYLVESSSDLTRWTPVKSFVATNLVTDLDLSGSTAREAFFRIAR